MARIRNATRSDNEGLLWLTSMTPMKGKISIRVDRNPNFFRLLDRRGCSQVLVAEEEGKIVGCISVACVPVHIDGKLESVYYLGDLKVHPDYQRTGLAVRLVKSMYRHLEAADADLVICTAAYGNQHVLPFFNGRAGLPKAVAIGMFKVFQIFPSPRRPNTTNYGIQEEPEHPDLYRLYNDYFRPYQFGPFFQPDSLQDARHWVARAGGDVQAALSLLDVGDSKQNVLIRLPLVLGILVTFFRSIHRVIPIANLPETNQPVRILYIKTLACRRGHEVALDLLVQRARNVSFEERYHFLVIGVHEKDPLAKRFVKYPKFIFKSLGFVVSLKRGNDEIDRLMREVPYEDYSLV